MEKKKRIGIFERMKPEPEREQFIHKLNAIRNASSVIVRFDDERVGESFRVGGKSP